MAPGSPLWLVGLVSLGGVVLAALFRNDAPPSSKPPEARAGFRAGYRIARSMHARKDRRE